MYCRPPPCIPYNHHTHMIQQIDHIGIAVKSLDATVPYYRDALGLGEPHIEEVPTQKVRVAMFDVAGVHIELLEPTSPESAIAKAIEKKGEGIHHIAFKTNDIAGNISQAKEAGLTVLKRPARPRRSQHAGHLPASQVHLRRPDRISASTPAAANAASNILPIHHTTIPMAIDPKLIDDLNSRRKKVILSGGQEKIDKRHEKGEMTARDRMGYLFEEGTFSEIGMHVRHNCHNFGMGKKEIPGDGVVSGFGLVDGRPVACAASDFLAQGGSLGYMHAMKIADAQKYALKAGIPMVTVNDSGGARLQEGVAALSGYAQVFYNNVLASGVVPQISMILGPCAGGAAYSPALTDFIIMRNSGNAGMYITGPKVIEQVTYEKCTMDDIGSAAIHATVSGNVHFVADSDAHAMDILKRLLSFLPSNNTEEPPHKLDTPLDLSADEGMSDLIPGDNRTPLDVQPIISRLVDNGDFLEVHKDFAKNVVVGFGRICGVVVGIIANQPNVKAGCLDIDSSDKAARFIRFCNAFNIPLVNLVDVPGFLPGKNQERGGIIRHGAKLIFAYSQATVPKVTLIMRKAYGGAYIAMCCKDLGADAVFAWPGAEIAVMGAEGAVPVLYGRELKAVEDPAEKAKRQGELLEEYREAFYNPYVAAGMGQITEVINPEETRAKIAFALRTLLNKKEVRPAKKHGNIPL